MHDEASLHSRSDWCCPIFPIVCLTLHWLLVTFLSRFPRQIECTVTSRNSVLSKLCPTLKIRSLEIEFEKPERCSFPATADSLESIILSWREHRNSKLDL